MSPTAEEVALRREAVRVPIPDANDGLGRLADASQGLPTWIEIGSEAPPT